MQRQSVLLIKWTGMLHGLRVCVDHTVFAHLGIDRKFKKIFSFEEET